MAANTNASISIDLKALDKTLKKLNTIGSNVANTGLRKALRAGAKVVLKQAKKNCPVDTGTLRKSLRVLAGKSKENVSYLVTTSGGHLFKGKAFYAGMVEDGVPSRGIPPNPFLRRALDLKQGEAKSVIFSTLQAYLKSAQAIQPTIRSQAVLEVQDKLAEAASFDALIKQRLRRRKASYDLQHEKFKAKVKENLKTSRTVFAKEDQELRERLERRKRNRNRKP